MSKMEQHYNQVHGFLANNPNSTVAQIALATDLSVGIVKAVLYANQQTAFEKTGVGGRHHPHRWLLRETVPSQAEAVTA